MNSNSTINLNQFTSDKNLLYSTVVCLYCHQYHLLKDLATMLCPKIIPYLPPYREVTIFECRICQGEGSYDEEITVKRYTRKRLIQFRKKLRNVRRCEQCAGTGKIKWMIYGCPSGNIINPTWARYKAYQSYNKNPACRLCYKAYGCEQTITSKCEHKFHLSCVEANKFQRLFCPTCKDIGLRNEMVGRSGSEVRQSSEDECDYSAAQN